MPAPSSFPRRRPAPRPARPRPSWCRLAGVLTLALAGAAHARPAAAQGAPRDDGPRLSFAAVDTLIPAALRAAVLQGSPELVARRRALAASQARLRAAGFGPAVVLSADASDAPNGRLDRGSLQVTVQRDFLIGGRRAAARGAASADVRAAEAALLVGERRVLAQALRAATQAAGFAAVARRLAAQDSLLVSAEGSLRTRFTVGEARYVDVLRLRTERLRVQTDRGAALAEARAGAVTLDALLGTTTVPAAAVGRDTASLVVPAFLVGPSTADPAALFGGALPPAPALDTLVALSAQVELANAAVAQAVAARQLLATSQRPLVSAGVGAQRISQLDGGGVGPTIGVAVTLPFTARRGNRAALVAAGRDVAAAGATRDAAVAALRGRIQAARERYEAARGRLAVYDATLLRGAREERESALAAYRSGEFSLLELLDFERALSTAEVERARAVVDAAAALSDLLGGSGDSPDPATTTDASTFRVSNER